MSMKLNNTRLNIKSYILFFILYILIFMDFLMTDDPVTSVTRSLVYYILIYCLNRGLREPFLLNPYILFSIVPLSLLIYSSEVSTFYLVNLTQRTWWFAIINMIAFIIALNSTHGAKTNKFKSIVSYTSLLKHGWILFVLATFPYLFYRLTGSYFPFHSIMQLLIYPALACIWKTKKKTPILLMYIIYIALIINIIDKTIVLGMILLISICALKYNIKLQKKQYYIIPIFLISAILMIVVFDYREYVRIGGDFFSYLQNRRTGFVSTSYFVQSGRIQWSGIRSLMMPYMYMVTPWANLQYVMETQATYTYGLWTLKPILGWFQIDSFFDSYYVFTAYSSFNTFTYLAVLFKDFGLWGAWIGSVFLGYFVKRIYNRFLLTQSPLDVSSYVLVAQATIQMFFSNHFFGLSYPFSIVIITAVYQFFFVKREKIYEN